MREQARHGRVAWEEAVRTGERDALSRGERTEKEGVSDQRAAEFDYDASSLSQSHDSRCFLTSISCCSSASMVGRGVEEEEEVAPSVSIAVGIPASTSSMPSASLAWLPRVGRIGAAIGWATLAMTRLEGGRRTGGWTKAATKRPDAVRHSRRRRAAQQTRTSYVRHTALPICQMRLVWRVSVVVLSFVSARGVCSSSVVAGSPLRSFRSAS